MRLSNDCCITPALQAQETSVHRLTRKRSPSAEGMCDSGCGDLDAWRRRRRENGRRKQARRRPAHQNSREGKRRRGRAGPDHTCHGETETQAFGTAADRTRAPIVSRRRGRSVFFCDGHVLFRDGHVFRNGHIRMVRAATMHRGRFGAAFLDGRHRTHRAGHTHGRAGACRRQDRERADYESRDDWSETGHVPPNLVPGTPPVK